MQLAEKTMDLKQQLDCMFNPLSVAVIGATNVPGKWGNGVMRGILQNKRDREVYPVNRRESEVMGLKAYSSILDIPYPVEFAALVIPAPALPQAMQQCVQKGVKAAIVITSGLAESGDDGARVQDELVRIARQGGIHFIGPNSMGHYDTCSGFCTTQGSMDTTRGPISVISQSGNCGTSMVVNGMQMGLGFNKFISSGNEASVHFEDWLEYLGQDDSTKVILGYVEGFREGRRFMEVARKVVKKKPVLLLKSGRTEAGARAARSHTSSLAGSDAVCDAALRQCGVIRAEDTTEMVDAALALLGQPLPRGKRVGVLTTGGGFGVLACDALKRHGLEIPPLSIDTINRLDPILAVRWPRANPVDSVGDVDNVFPCLWEMLPDEIIDSVVMVGVIGMDRGMGKSLEQQELDDIEKLKAMMRRCQKPVLLVNMVNRVSSNSRARAQLEQDYLTPYLGPERAVRALVHLVERSEYLRSCGES